MKQLIDRTLTAMKRRVAGILNVGDRVQYKL